MSLLRCSQSLLARPQPAWGLLGACWPPSVSRFNAASGHALGSSTPPRVAPPQAASQASLTGSWPSQHTSEALRQIQAIASGIDGLHSPVPVLPKLDQAIANSAIELSQNVDLDDCWSGAWDGVKNFKVSSIRKVADDCAELTFIPADHDIVGVDFTPGQHLELHSDTASPLRCIVTSAPGKPTMQCCVQSEGGVPKAGSCNGVRAGSIVGLTAPRGARLVSAKPMVLISAGLGAAYTKAVIETGARNIRLALHVDRSQTSHAFRSEFRRSCVSTSFHYTAEQGRPSMDTIVKQLRPYLSTCDFVISGPPTFAESMRSALAAAGAEAVRIHRLSRTPPAAILQSERLTFGPMEQSSAQPRQ